MSAVTATLDSWTGPRLQEIQCLGCSLGDVRDLLRKLDGKSHTLLGLERDGRTMMVGGGPDSFVVTFADASGADWSSWTSSGRSGTMVTICAGGQEGEFDAFQALDIDTAMSAVACFCDGGEMAPGLNWRQ